MFKLLLLLITWDSVGINNMLNIYNIVTRNLLSSRSPNTLNKLATSISAFSSTTITAARNNSSALTSRLLAEGNGGKKIVGYWLAGTSAAVFGIIVFGGLTRLTESGLSMVDWKLIHFTAPSNEAEWEAYFEKYKQFPEYKMYTQKKTYHDILKFVFF